MDAHVNQKRQFRVTISLLLFIVATTAVGIALVRRALRYDPVSAATSIAERAIPKFVRTQYRVEEIVSSDDGYDWNVHFSPINKSIGRPAVRVMVPKNPRQERVYPVKSSDAASQDQVD
jgi:uncharacterized membrane protein